MAHWGNTAIVSGGWQPIETAPKDGTPVLCGFVGQRLNAKVIFWDDEAEWWCVDDNKLGPHVLRGPAPTHWMPIPPPPEAG